MCFTLAIVCTALAFFLAREHDARRRLQLRVFDLSIRLADSEEYRELVKKSALRGNPLVKWNLHSTGVTYFRARFEGVEYLFTSEAVAQAKRMADLLIIPPTQCDQQLPTCR
jgi:hypothetical protein